MAFLNFEVYEKL